MADLEGKQLVLRNGCMPELMMQTEIDLLPVKRFKGEL
jgi:hypothetical protein